MPAQVGPLVPKIARVSGAEHVATRHLRYLRSVVGCWTDDSLSWQGVCLSFEVCLDFIMLADRISGVVAASSLIRVKPQWRNR